MSWNTARVKLKETLESKYENLTTGEYIVYADTHVTYEYVEDKLTGRKAPSNTILAAGKLRIVVK